MQIDSLFTGFINRRYGKPPPNFHVLEIRKGFVDVAQGSIDRTYLGRIKLDANMYGNFQGFLPVTQGQRSRPISQFFFVAQPSQGGSKSLAKTALNIHHRKLRWQRNISIFNRGIHLPSWLFFNCHVGFRGSVVPTNIPLITLPFDPSQHVSNEKRPLVVQGIFRDWHATQLCGDYFISHEIRILVMKQPGFNGEYWDVISQEFSTWRTDQWVISPILKKIGGYF